MSSGVAAGLSRLAEEGCVPKLCGTEKKIQGYEGHETNVV